MQHDSSSVLAMETNTVHNALCIRLKFVQIAIVRSAWRQPNISKHTSTVSGNENFPICAVYDIVNGLILIFVQRTGLQSIKQDWEKFRFYKLYNNLIRGNSTNTSKNTIDCPIERTLSASRSARCCITTDEWQTLLSSDQLRAASLIGWNAVTWLCALSTVRRA